MKRTLTVLLCLFLILSSALASGAKEEIETKADNEITSAPIAENKEEGQIYVYAKVPSDWNYPCIWAWDVNGVSAFASWPGEMMEPDPANEGWYYLYLPSSMNSIIVNANDGSVQTADYQIEGNSWVIVNADGSATVSKAKMTTGDVPEYTERFTLYAQVDDDWVSPSVWAWEDPSGKNAFAAWPGRTMKPSNNGWYSAKVPVWCNSIIVNANDGTVQTVDIKDLDPADMWICVKGDGSFELTYEDPTIPKVEDITVFVKVPSDWDNPCVWAWSHPDGTNAFVSWPGEALNKGSDGWFELDVPGWINSIIINGNSGSIQTSDLRVDTGKDLYITVVDSDNVELSYE